MQRVPSAPASSEEKTDSNDFQLPSGRLSTSNRRSNELLAARGGGSTNEIAINAVVAVITQLDSNSSSAEALLEVLLSDVVNPGNKGLLPSSNDNATSDDKSQKG